MGSIMRRLHLIAGLVGVLLFLASGAYMHFGYDHLRSVDTTTRLLFRSGHINLFFAAVMNAMVGLYHVPAASAWRRLFQTMGSTLLLAAIVLCGIGFLVEPGLTDLERPYSRLGIYGTLAALVFSLLAAWPASRGTGSLR
jgi:hypothetical protein